MDGRSLLVQGWEGLLGLLSRFWAALVAALAALGVAAGALANLDKVRRGARPDEQETSIDAGGRSDGG